MALVGTDEPLVLADGSVVHPDGRVEKPGAPRLVEVPTNREAQQLVVQTRRRLADLPDVPRTMNAIGVVLSYTLFGLDNHEIALATGLTEQQVGNIKMLDAFDTMKNDVVTGILHAETDNVRDVFTQHARKAASSVVALLESGREDVRMKAASDILDRGGFRPADVVEHKHKLEGGLTIEIVRKRDDVAPVIDIMPEGDI